MTDDPSQNDFGQILGTRVRPRGGLDPERLHGDTSMKDSMTLEKSRVNATALQVDSCITPSDITKRSAYVE